MISILSYAYNAYQADFSGKPKGKQDIKDMKQGDPPEARTGQAHGHHHQQSSGVSGVPDQPAATEQSLLSNQPSSSSLNEVV